MDTWTKQMGYPVLSLTNTDTEAKLTQTRFLLDPNADHNQPSTPLGWVRLCHAMKISMESNTENQSFYHESNRPNILLNKISIHAMHTLGKCIYCISHTANLQVNLHQNTVQSNAQPLTSRTKHLCSIYFAFWILHNYMVGLSLRSALHCSGIL